MLPTTIYSEGGKKSDSFRETISARPKTTSSDFSREVIFSILAGEKSHGLRVTTYEPKAVEISASAIITGALPAVKCPIFAARR